VNFAKATEGENINYVIPVWRVRQMVTKHFKDQPERPEGGWKRVQVKVPSSELTTIVPNEPLYANSGGCSEGLYVSRIGQRSPFRRASPPLKQGSFLTAVNGRSLDPFGTGMHDGFVADRVSYSDLLFMVEDFSAGVEVESCYQGNKTKHNVSMLWAQDNERGLQYIDEPNIEGMGAKYEMFGEMAVMQMTVNHIDAVLYYYGDPGPARWLYPDFVTQPRLVISWLQPGSYASNIFMPGAAVAKVNGVDVRTLDDFREHFQPKNSTVWTLETDMGEVVVLDFNGTLKRQVDTAIAMNAPHLLTTAVISAAERFGIKHREEPSASPGCDEAVAKLPTHGHGDSGAKLAALTGIAIQARAKAPGTPLRAAGPVPVVRSALKDGRHGFAARSLVAGGVGRDRASAAAQPAQLSAPRA